MPKRAKTTSCRQPSKKKKSSSSTSTPPEKYQFVWAKLRGVPCWWPVQVISEEESMMQIYVKSDNALLMIKSEDIKAFPGNFDVIKHQGLELLKRKKLKTNLSCYLSDVEWARRETEDPQTEQAVDPGIVPAIDLDTNIRDSGPRDHAGCQSRDRQRRKTEVPETEQAVDTEGGAKGTRDRQKRPRKKTEVPETEPAVNTEGGDKGTRDRAGCRPKDRQKRPRQKTEVPDTEQAVDPDNELAVDTDTDKGIYTDTEQSVETNSEPAVDLDAEQAVNQDTEQAVDQDTEQAFSRDNEPAVDTDTEQAVDQDTEQAVNPDNEPAVDTDTDKGIYMDTEQSVETVSEPAVDFDTKQADNTYTEPAVDTDTEQAVDTDTEPAVNADTEPAVNPDTEPAVNPDTEPAVNPDTEQAVDTDTEQAFNPDNELAVDTDTDKGIYRDTEQSVETVSEPAVDFDTKQADNTYTEPAVDTDTEQAVDTDTEPAVNADTEPAVNPDTEQAVDTDTDKGTYIMYMAVDTDTEWAVDPDTEQAVDPDTEQAVDPDTEQAVDPDTEQAVDQDTEQAVDSLDDCDSDYVYESESEGTTRTSLFNIPLATNREQGRYLKECQLLRDVNQPGIYVRKIRKTSKSSKAQANVKNPDNTRVYDNYHACLYCGEMRQHIKQHLETHKRIPEVQQLFKDANPNIARMRKLGDHRHNQKVITEGIGELILSRRPEEFLDNTLYGPCKICKEWILLKNLDRHIFKCSPEKLHLSKRQLIIESQVEAGVISNTPSKLMMNEVFPSMRLDRIGQVAKTDTCIVALGESWLRRSIDNREKRKYYTSQHMRLMAKLLIEVRNLDKDRRTDKETPFSDYLRPQYFDMIVAAALECCFPYLDDIEELQSPSNGIKIKYDLQRMLTARWAMLVKVDPHSEFAKEVRTCQRLVSIEWAEKITKLSRSVMVRRSLTMKKELPAPEDVLKLTKYVTSELKTVPLTSEKYHTVVQLTQARILIYNKRRSGEVDAIRLDNYAGRTCDVDEMDESMIEDLTEMERYLLKSQELMKVRGKGNRPVPVLMPVDTKKPLQFIASRTARREAGIPDQNVYLFPNSALSHARSYTSVKKVCEECVLASPTRITSVSMRKYTATLTQMLNLDQYQMDWVCRHLGHTTDVHKAHYRQMSGLVERVYVTKMLLVQDLNLTKKFKGQTLDEIDISDLVFPDGDGDGDNRIEDNTNLVDTVVGDIPRNERDDEPADSVVFQEDSDVEEEEDEEMESEELLGKKTQSTAKATPITRQRWDTVEMEEINKFFKSYLDSGVTPRKNEVDSAKKKSKTNGGKIWMRSNDKIIKKISAMNHKK